MYFEGYWFRIRHSLSLCSTVVRSRQMVRFAERRDVIPKFVKDKGLHVPEFDETS